MKKFYLVALFALICNLASAQMERTTYRGAFAPAPAAMWTDTWTNWNPQDEAYPDKSPALTDAAGTNSNVVNVTANVTANTTWYATKTYKLKNIIYVGSNVTLTIQPGTVIKGESGSALVITKGAKINATGTASLPIVFTSSKAAKSRAAADWGGVVVLGKAGFNLNSGINNIEGIFATTNTQYGGGSTPNDADNSGTLKYVRIEYAGFVFSPNNELNGLTFGAVGNGTTVDYVQVSYSGDDSFEWFGGSVNCKHLVAYKGLDDDFDTDNGYKGFVQFALGVRDPNIADNPAVSTSEGFESDNNASTVEAATGYDNTTAIFTNCTLLGPSKRATSVASGYARALRLRRSTEIKIYNSVFLDFKNNYAGLTDDQTIAKYYSGKLKLKNNIFAGFYGTDFTNFPKGINPVSKTGNATTNALGLPTSTVFNLSDKMVADGNLTQLSSDGVLTTPYNTADYTSYAGMDYRPATDSPALSSADFTDASLTSYLPVIVDSSTPAASNRNYCVGDIATPLSAELSSTGVSLKWYIEPTGGTPSLVAPTPLTTVAGVQTFYVSQIKTDASESARVAITVTVSVKPSEVISVITGTGPVGSTSAVAVGPYVGTSATFTYSVSTFVDATLTYLWTVPNGANIVGGQGTNTVTVNYLDVAPGAGALGTINVQAVNAGGCKTVAKSLAITKALPVAPSAIKLTNAALPVSVTTGLATAITAYTTYMGTTTPLTLTATASVGATSYEWSLPAGVNVDINGVTPVVTTLYYTAEPFLAPAASESAITGPAAAGLKYYAVTYNTYNDVMVNGVATKIVISTAKLKIFSKISPAFVAIDYPAYGKVVTSDKNAILVNFSGVTNSSTTALYLGVKSRNGVGSSVTSNVTNVDAVASAAAPQSAILGLYNRTYTETYVPPVNNVSNASSSFAATGYELSSAKLLKLTATLPAAPAALVMKNTAISATVAVTNVSKYVGTSTPLTLTATASVLATSYEWELPAGVTQLTGGTSNVITIDLSNVAAGTTYLYFGVKAKNAIGVSSTVNTTLVPATSSTARLLKVLASVPLAVATVTGQTFGICAGSSYNYNMVASALANSYVITAPAGTTINNTDSNVLATSDLSFTVNYPIDFTGHTTLAPKTISIVGVNGLGNSTAKVLVIYKSMAAIGVATGSAGITTFTRCATQTFTVPAVVGATEYVWTPANGAEIVSGQGTSTVEVNFSGVADVVTSNLLKVVAKNACGVSSAIKIITLASTACPIVPAPAQFSSVVNVSEMYPNPTMGTFNVNVELLSSTTADVTMTVYSFDGTVVSTKNLNLSEGNNVINEDLSSQRNGIYIVKINNPSTGEVIINKLVKQ